MHERQARAFSEQLEQLQANWQHRQANTEHERTERRQVGSVRRLITRADVGC
jgi:hypothetical protein